MCNYQHKFDNNFKMAFDRSDYVLPNMKVLEVNK